MKHEVRHMRSAGGGVIVNTAANVGAHQRQAGMAAYAATKATVSAMTRGAALDYIGDGIRINAISPGPIDTVMSLRSGETPADRAAPTRHQPHRPSGSLGEVAAAVLWLCSTESSFTVGHDLVLDGGASA
jgi:NAD(P)-dependent dehydrogenase (short-subunit alcohol dehydrogenase family)